MNFAGKFDATSFAGSLHSPLDSHVHLETLAREDQSNTITVRDANLLFAGDYKKSGVDLILTKNGQGLVIKDYFKGEKQASLASPDGAHLTGDIVNSLSGGHVQYAQAAGSLNNAVIGHVTKLTGTASVIRNGVSIILNNGDNVEKGDVVQSGSGSSLGITFIDGTVFGLASNARMVLNEMVYDPNGSSNSSLLSLIQGTITFVAGETAKHGDMKIDTPTATMGIRGTAVLVEIDFQIPGQGNAPPVKFQVLAEPDGHTGSYVLFNKPTDGSDPVQIGTVNQSGQSYSVTATGVSQQAAAALPSEAAAIVQEVFSLSFQNYTPPVTPKSISPGNGSSTPPAPGNPLDTSPIKDVPVGTTSPIVPINITVPVSPTDPSIKSTIPVTITFFPDNAAPTITFSSEGGPTNQTTHVIAGSVAAGLFSIPSTVTFFDTINGVTSKIGVAPVHPDGSFEAAITLSGNGTHSISAQDSDAAGNTGTTAVPIVFALEMRVPIVAIAAPGGTTNSTTHVIEGSVAAGGAAIGEIVTLFDTVNGNTTPIGTATVGRGGVWTTTVTLSGDGIHSIVAQDTDAVGNVGTSTPVLFALDTVAPTVAITSAGLTTNHAAQTASGTGEAGTTVTLFDNGAALTAVTVDQAGHWSAGITLSNGANSLTAQNTDAAGNVGTSTPILFTLDTVAPTVAITSAGLTTNHAAQTASGTGEAGTTVTLFDNGAALTAVTVDQTGHWSAGITLSNGANSLTAQDADAAGNVGTSTPVLFTLDTVAPTVAITSAGLTTNHAAQTVSGTGEAGTMVTLFDNGAALTAVTVDQTGHWSAGITLSNGANSLTAQDADAAGNVGTSTPVLFALDTVAPTVAITSAGLTTNHAAQTVSGTGEAGTAVTLFDNDTALTAVTVDQTGHWSAGIALSNGANSLTAQDIDAAGNVGTSTPVLFTLDTVAPTVAITSAGLTTNNAAQTVSGTGEAGTTVTLFDNGAALPAITVDPTGHWSAGITLSNGANSLIATDADVTGNVGTSSVIVFTLDTVAPTVAITSDDLTTNYAAQTVSGTGEAGTTVTLFDNDTALTPVTVDQTGHWSAGITLINGANSLTAQDIDAAGNTGTSTPVLFTLDTVAPTVTEALAADTGFSATDGITSDDVLTGAGVANTVVHFNIDGAWVDTTTADAEGIWSFTPTGLPDGTHTVVASQTDDFGNTGSATLSFTLDTTAPVVAITATPAVAAAGTTTNAWYTISGTVDPADAGTTITILDSFTPTGSISPYGAHLLTAGHDLVSGLGGATGFGTQTLAMDDDNSSSAIDITSVFGSAGVDFFGKNYTSLYVNNNGNITFASPSSTFTPSVIDGGVNNPIIAPFWADVDTRGGPATATPGGNSTGANQVIYNLDPTNGVLTITWDDVGYYNSATDKLNAFQVQLISLGEGNFDIVYRYENIDWTTGTASGGEHGLGGTPARAGYSAGNGTNYFELPQSGNQAELLSLASTLGNTGIAGVDVFQVVKGVVSTPTATILGTATVQPDGSWSTNVALADGNNSITAQDTDAAGNVGTSAPVELNVGAGHSFNNALRENVSASSPEPVSWQYAINGDFATPSDWNTHIVPGSADNAVIDAAGNHTVTSAASETLNSLIVNFDTTLDIIGGTFTLLGVSGSSEIDGLIKVEHAGSALNLGGIVANNGTLEAYDAAPQSIPPATIALESAQIAGGAIEAIAGGKIDVASGQDEIHGVAVTVDLDSSLVVENGAALQLDDGTSITAGTITNHGTIEISRDTVTIDGLVTGDGLIEIDAHATLKLGGSTIGSPTVDNNGLIESVTSSVLTGAITGTGAIHIDDGASLELSGKSPIADQVVTFEGATGALKLDNAQFFHATIAGFSGNGQLSGSDQIDLLNINFNSGHFTKTIDAAGEELTISDGINTADLHFTGFAGSFAFAGDGNNGTIVYDPPVPSTFHAGATDNKIMTAVDQNGVGTANHILNDVGGKAFKFNFDEQANHISSDSTDVEFAASLMNAKVGVMDLAHHLGQADTNINLDEHTALSHDWISKSAFNFGDFHLT